MRNLIVATVLLLLFCTPAQVAGNYIGWHTVERVHAYKAHTGLLYEMDYMVHNSCTSSHWYILPSGHPYYAEINKLMVLARTMNRKIAITLEGCHEGYPVIRDAYY